MKNVALIALAIVVAIGGFYIFTNQAEAPQTPDPGTDSVVLYYYSEERDRDASGNIMCSREGVVPVQRELANSDNLIEDSIKLLLTGQLSAEEQNQGISTEYPLDEFALVDSNLADGVLTLTFSDPLNRTSGGSCRAGILWYQIEQTALGFFEVSSVEFAPEELFQP